MVGLTFATAIAGFIIIVIAWRQFRDQSAANAANLRIAQDAANAAKASVDGLKSAERAYVGFRNQEFGEQWTNDPGFHMRDAKNERHTLEIRVRNTGGTPATIHGGIVRPVALLDENKFTPPVQLPKGGQDFIHGNFLHAGDHYIQKLFYDLTAAENDALGSGRLWLVGYFDYTDAFGVNHRAGYCRRVNRKPMFPTRNNLFIDHVSGPYNYDDEIDEQGNRKQARR